MKELDKIGLIISLFLLLSSCLSHSSSVSSPKLYVALTFDYEDLYLNDNGTANMPEILKILEKHNATATFFVLGKTAKLHEDVIKELKARGYSIGVHTYFHNMPVFNKRDALLIDKIYHVNNTWERSFKNSQAFLADLQRCLNETELMPMFRSPCLALNWVSNREEYFETLEKAGIIIDSSLYQEDKPFYYVGKVIEVPVTMSEDKFEHKKIAEKIENCTNKNLPLVIVMHPQKLSLRNFEEFLNFIEANYNVTYIKIEEVPTIYAQ